MSVKPITSDEVVTAKGEIMPDFVKEIINDLIVKNWKVNRACVYQKDIVAKLRDADSRDPFAEGWLDFEPIYQEAGWNVEYDKPGWDETYDAHFIFTKKRK